MKTTAHRCMISSSRHFEATTLYVYNCHKNSVLSCIQDLLELLWDQSPEHLEAAVARILVATYHAEVAQLAQKGTGFHFTGMQANLEQLEEFSVEKMGTIIHRVAPQLWDLLGVLLDSRIDHRRTQPDQNHTGLQTNNNVDMEPAFIATDVFGNDSGSSKESDEDVEELDDDLDESSNDGHLESIKSKWHYQKQNPVRRNAALIFIVSNLLYCIHCSCTYMHTAVRCYSDGLGEQYKQRC